MLQSIQALQNTPLPTILVVAGIFFILLSIAGGISGRITVPLRRQRSAGALGGVFVLLGLGLYLVQPKTENPGELIEHISRQDGITRSTSTNPDFNTTHPETVFVVPLPTNLDTTESSNILAELKYRDWPIIGQTDFSHNRSTWKTGSYPSEHTALNITIIDGVYRIAFTPDRNEYRTIRTPHGPASDFYLSVDIRFVTTDVPNMRAGLLFRGTGKRYYYLSIQSNHSYRLSYWNGKEDTHLTEWVPLPGFDPYESNQFAIKAVADKLTIYLNGAHIGEVVDAAEASGYVALFVESPALTDREAIFEFDNFTYRRMP